MAIDFESGELVEISKMPTRLEKLIGKRLNISTIYRWMNKGIAGIRLETVLVGGQRYTSLAWVQRFVELSTAEKNRRLAMAKQSDQSVPIKQEFPACAPARGDQR